MPDAVAAEVRLLGFEYGLDGDIEAKLLSIQDGEATISLEVDYSETIDTYKGKGTLLWDREDGAPISLNLLRASKRTQKLPTGKASRLRLLQRFGVTEKSP